LFKVGSYIPLGVRGEFADCCVAFAREHEGKWIALMVPRLSSRVGFPPIGESWKDTAVELPVGLGRSGAQELFTGRELREENGALTLSEALAGLPFATYTNQGAAIYKSPTL
jgi:(1->4)-alpha-D-glucan 1-alpha-D-glucosylmutase